MLRMMSFLIGIFPSLMMGAANGYGPVIPIVHPLQYLNPNLYRFGPGPRKPVQYTKEFIGDPVLL